jgi:hypothetical protein
LVRVTVGTAHHKGLEPAFFDLRPHRLDLIDVGHIGESSNLLVRGLAGYASSLAAVAGVSDLDVAMLVSRRRVGEYMDATGRDSRELVLAKRERLV